MIGMGFTSLDQDWPSEVTHVRLWDIGVTWKDINTAPGVYDWSRLDTAVAKAGDRHITYVVGACPRWLAKYPDNPHYAPWLGPGSNSMPYSLAEANDFALHLATRYKGRIDAYEIWNEPQLADFLYPYETSEVNALARMTERFYGTIKATDPSAMVLAGSVLPRDSSGGMKRARKYLLALKERGWPVDAFTCHLYPEIGTGVKRWKVMLDEVVAELVALGAPTKRLWVTETGYGLLGDPIPDEKAAQLVTDTYANGNGRFIFWYAWDRPDLGGMYIGPSSAAWTTIKGVNNA